MKKKDVNEETYITKLVNLCQRIKELEASEKELKRATDLLNILNEATLAMESALTPEDVFSELVNKFKKLGMDCIVFIVDESENFVSPEYLSYDRKLLRLAEKLVNIKAKNFSISIEDVKLYKEVVREKKTVFVKDAEEITQMVLPDFAKRLAGQILKILRIPSFILAPVIVENKVTGILSVQSQNLTEKDVAAITAFAHRLAATWSKTRLVEDLRNKLEELKNTRAQLLQAQKLEVLGALAGGVAHDFNNLLTVISGYSEAILNSMGDEEDQIRSIKQIKRSIGRGAALTRQLLAFGRRQVIQPRTIELNTLIKSMVKMLERFIGEDINITTDLYKGLHSVKADPSQIEQVLMNLCINARDAMPEGGTIVIKTENIILKEEDLSPVPEGKTGEFVSLSVSDRGTGMDKDTIAHIFEPFYTTKVPGKGTGLGLSVVYGIVTDHMGWINVESEPGEGTVFRIYLPAIKAQSDNKAEENREKCYYFRGKGEKILLVEDDEDIREVTKNILNAYGYTVIETSSAKSAIEIFKRENGKISLLFSDVILPDKTGIQLVKELLSHGGQLKILMTSGYEAEKSQLPLIQEMALPFIRKPYTAIELLLAIKEVFSPQS